MGYYVSFNSFKVMVKIDLIGNLGADARVVNANGAQFVSFNVADNKKVNGTEVTQWYSCNINRDVSKLMPYLVKGQNVFVRGTPRYRIVDSSVHHMKIVSIDIFVDEIQLIGSQPTKDPTPPQEPEKESTGEPVQVY